jgi:hypothetical protein
MKIQACICHGPAGSCMMDDGPWPTLAQEMARNRESKSSGSRTHLGRTPVRMAEGTVAGMGPGLARVRYGSAVCSLHRRRTTRAPATPRPELPRLVAASACSQGLKHVIAQKFAEWGASSTVADGCDRFRLGSCLAFDHPPCSLTKAGGRSDSWSRGESLCSGSPGRL